ncbi:DUF350 domain-containing protein [Echinimonas agarilytica]|uniref:DUF350 domain-containing protein n=1 Tax=Echinimonas agarilytica TaxID=1215918 RepID=A0AA41W7N5_9GAMM|nr:DUF350 domain-containing protein [Echinimonas agarilytica]MCM2679908.1 DUF350 domain-containing protein [Echinimonas agarilytica]
MLIESLQGIPAFALYFAVGYGLILLFGAVYSKVTPYCEWTLMSQNNKAAATAFGLSLVGYTIPVASAAINSVSLVDYAMWGLVALVTQLITFTTVRLYMKGLIEKINEDQLSAGIFLGCAAIATGILNAACMTY